MQALIILHKEKVMGKDSNAASSTASGVVVVEAPQHKKVEHLTLEERTVWLKGGDLPLLEKKIEEETKGPAKSDDSGTSKPAAEADGKKSESGTDDKAADKSGDKGDKDKDKNWRELREKATKFENETKTERDLRVKAEAELEEWRSGKKKREEKAVSAETVPPVSTKPEAPKKPLIREFVKEGILDEKAFDEALEKFDKAKDEYPSKLSTWEKQQEASVAAKKRFDTWKGEFAKLTSVDEAEKVFGAQSDLSISTKIAAYMEEIPEANVWAGVLQHFNKNRDDIKRVTELPQRERIKALEKIEDDVREALKPKEEKPDKKKENLSRAGKPPEEAGSTGGAAEDDDADAALKRGDGDEYRRIMNERERAKFAEKFAKRRKR